MYSPPTCWAWCRPRWWHRTTDWNPRWWWCWTGRRWRPPGNWSAGWGRRWRWSCTEREDLYPQHLYCSSTYSRVQIWRRASRYMDIFEHINNELSWPVLSCPQLWIRWLPVTHSSCPLHSRNSSLHACTADRMREAIPTKVMKLQEDSGPHSSTMKRCFDTVMFSFCHMPRVKSRHFPPKSSVFSDRGTTAMKPNTKAKK